MALINEPILDQTFELIRDRIVLILELEIPNQNVLQPGLNLNPTIVKERSVKFDANQGDLLNIFFVSNVPANKIPVSVTSDLTYYIDVWTGRNDTDTESGDELSRIANQRYIGLIRGILEATVYKHLGFDIEKPIQTTKFSVIEIAPPDDRSDSNNISQSRLQFEVRSTDINIVQGVRELDEVEVQFKLGETDKGNLFIKDTN